MSKRIGNIIKFPVIEQEYGFNVRSDQHGQIQTVTDLKGFIFYISEKIYPTNSFLTNRIRACHIGLQSDLCKRKKKRKIEFVNSEKILVDSEKM